MESVDTDCLNELPPPIVSIPRRKEHARSHPYLQTTQCDAAPLLLVQRLESLLYVDHNVHQHSDTSIQLQTTAHLLMRVAGLAFCMFSYL